MEYSAQLRDIEKLSWYQLDGKRHRLLLNDAMTRSADGGVREDDREHHVFCAGTGCLKVS